MEHQIIDISTEMFFGYSRLYLVGDYLIVETETEVEPSIYKGIHLFDKYTFQYITSSAIIGRGPGEVVRLGKIGVNNKDLWICDYGKKVRWKFPLDSVLKDDRYKPVVNLQMHSELYMIKQGFLNDSIAIGKAIHSIVSSSPVTAMAKLNINTNVTERYGYEHPDITGRMTNSVFKLSPDNELYINCYMYCDLMTICNLDGTLKYNIYGPNWKKYRPGEMAYFYGVDTYKNFIIVSYVGDKRIVLNEYQRQEGNFPTKFQIFNTKGDYIKTLETGYKFSSFCVDEENERLIIYFDDRKNPLAYIPLNLD
ncbi:MAG: hypothetical protein ACEPOZ_06235 [Marinifilaceae bacterium]